MDFRGVSTLDHRPKVDRTAHEHIGTFAGFAFKNDETKFVIAKLKDGWFMKGSCEPEYFTVGGRYRFMGRWQEDAKFGLQFFFSSVVMDEPHDKFGVITYLTKMASNVGERKALKLWDTFGQDAVEILRSKPELVAEHGILSIEAAREAAADLRANSALERTTIDLHSIFNGRGFSGKAIQKAVEVWGAKAPQIIQRDPYKLLVNGIPGAGWKRCDKLYLDRGGNPVRLKRQMLFLWNAVRCETDGSTWVAASRLVELLREGIGGSNSSIDPVRAMKLGKRAGWLSVRRDNDNIPWVTETDRHLAEATVAQHLIRLSRHKHNNWPGPNEIPVSQVEGDRLPSQHQVDEVRKALAGPVGVLLGGPGTGKTHTLAFVIKQILEHYPSGLIALVSPTGKAAVRMNESLRSQGINNLKATTIHKFLGIQGNVNAQEFTHNEKCLVPKRFVIVDEVSMVDVSLMASLLRALPSCCHVLFIGDLYQLPPVGHGAPIRDMIKFGLPYGELTEVRRNAGQIVHACVSIKQGQSFDTCNKYDAEQGHNLRFIHTSSPKQSLEVLQDLLGRMKSFDPVLQTQVLVASNTRGELARQPINKILQPLLNPSGRGVGSNPYRIGDKVICLQNVKLNAVAPKWGREDSEAQNADDWNVLTDSDQDGESFEKLHMHRSGGEPIEQFTANGEIGFVLAVSDRWVVARFSEAEHPVRFLAKQFKSDDEGEDRNEDGREGSSRQTFDLAYAITVHKSQGSESPCVIILADPAAGPMVDRHWWYTAISRASKLCILIGSKDVIDRQRLKQSLKQRKTFLAEALMEVSATASKNDPVVDTTASDEIEAK
jgi:exodeoxyribonuclease V alpha subunit